MIKYQDLTDEQFELFYKIFIRALKNLGLFPFHTNNLTGKNRSKKKDFIEYFKTNLPYSDVIRCPWDEMWHYNKTHITSINASLLIIEMCGDSRLYSIVSEKISRREFEDVIIRIKKHELNYICSNHNQNNFFSNLKLVNAIKLYNYFVQMNMAEKANQCGFKYVEGLETLSKYERLCILQHSKGKDII